MSLISKTEFNNLPQRFFFFEDTEYALYFDGTARNIYHSGNEGKEWSRVESIPKGSIVQLVNHPSEKKTAFAFTLGTSHYKTSDAGISWTRFTTPIAPASVSLSFRFDRPNYAIFHGKRCVQDSHWSEVEICHRDAYYTKDSFENLKLLKSYVGQCIFAQSTEHFQNVPGNTILCTENVDHNRALVPASTRLVVSEDYFETTSNIDFGKSGVGPNGVTGVIGVGVIEKFLVSASVSGNDNELYVSTDARVWSKATTAPAGAYTILESAPYSLFVDVMASSRSVTGTLLSSNSEGVDFVESLHHTNRLQIGVVDFERVKAADGIVIANVVRNYDQAEAGAPKLLQTKISFDEGGEWHFLKPPRKDIFNNDYNCNEETIKSGDCALHLYSVTSPHNIGRVFTSTSTPGLVMGVGSVGPHLQQYDACDTFLSDDGGLTWKAVREGAHKYEFVDMGSIFVTVDDEKPTSKISYSWNRGADWTDLDLGITVTAELLTTVSDSTSQSVLLLGRVRKGSSLSYIMFHINFGALDKRKCVEISNGSSPDFEKWHPTGPGRNTDKQCLMGKSVSYWRRKADADCSVNQKFADLKTEETVCSCDEDDYECDYNFIRDSNKKCIPHGPERIPKDACQNVGDKYMATSGYRKIPGNVCEGGVELDKRVEKTCSAVGGGGSASGGGKISSTTTILAKPIDRFFYFPGSDVVMMTDQDAVGWRSVDGGKRWQKMLEGQNVRGLILHDFQEKTAFLFMADDSLKITKNRGESFTDIKLPLPTNKFGLAMMDFHPDDPDWFLILTATECVAGSNNGCHTVAQLTQNGGATWREIDTWADKCMFGKDAEFKATSKETIFCTTWRNKNTGMSQNVLKGNPGPNNWKQLVRTDDFGRTKEVIVDKVDQFFMLSDFMAAAAERDGLKLLVSNDGKVFKEAIFPPNMKMSKNFFTLLDSSTGTVFMNLFETTADQKGFGNLFVSNRDGVAFALSLPNTNVNYDGVVDFEKIRGMDGVILANRLVNSDDVRRGANKKVETVISFDDGGHWRTLKAPEKDMNGAPYACSGQSDCKLHLHGRSDIRKPGPIFTAKTAPGLIIGVGNVGPYMTSDTKNTYLSRDAGKSWTEIHKGEKLWEFGDHGGVLVVVDSEKPTDRISYSINYGKSWTDYKFSDTEVRVIILTTEPSYTSTSMVLLGITAPSGDRDAEVFITHIDTSRLFDRDCQGDLNSSATSSGDFEKWHPSDPNGSICQMGHEVTFWRRKQESLCHVGNLLDNVKIVGKNCPCTEDDYECDYNFWRDTDGKCKLYGVDPDQPPHLKKGETYMGSSGYRKEAKNTCDGGLNLEEKVQREAVEASGLGIVSQTFTLDSAVVNYYYFIKSETVILQTKGGKVYLSANGGGSWNQPLENTDASNEEVVNVLINPHFEQRAYLITPGKVAWKTVDRGATFSKLYLPAEPNPLGITMVNFHPEEEDWMIFIGSVGCGERSSELCHSVAYVTKDGGNSWHPMGTYVRSCIFARDSKFTHAQRSLVFCEKYQKTTGTQWDYHNVPIALHRSDDFFEKDDRVMFKSVVGYALVEEYMIVAELDESSRGLRLQVSVDGENFAEGRMPAGVNINNAYTVLESTTGSVFLQVKSSPKPGVWGDICKSNYNGTYYTTSLNNVNANDRGLVDFEKVQGLQGIALANVVTNPSTAVIGNRKLQSRITFNDGGKWKPLQAPKTDVDGAEYNCRDCPLNLHSYTRRRDPRNMFSTKSGIGILMGVGNVDNNLTPYTDGDVFLSRDAGVTWTEVRKGAHFFEIGDNGGLILLVDDEQPTDTVHYSTDMGTHWTPYKFQDDPIRVDNVISEPEGTSRKLLLYGKNMNTNKYVVSSLDFTNLVTADGQPQKQCILDADLDSPNDDFEAWTPTDSDSNCLFGNKMTYYRRNPAKDCYVGDALDKHKGNITKRTDCPCIRADFECDFNFLPDGNGNCNLVAGTQPLQTTCATKWTPSYTISTGYRKLVISTCSGGLELDKGPEIPCPGHGLSAGGWFAVIVIPLMVVSLFLLCHLHRRRGGRVGDFIPYFAGGWASLISKIPVPAFVANLYERLQSRRSGSYTRLPVEDPIDVLMDDYVSPEIL